jgi:hypothetical protein
MSGCIVSISPIRSKQSGICTAGCRRIPYSQRDSTLRLMWIHVIPDPAFSIRNLLSSAESKVLSLSWFWAALHLLATRREWPSHVVNVSSTVQNCDSCKIRTERWRAIPRNPRPNASPQIQRFSVSTVERDRQLLLHESRILLNQRDWSLMVCSLLGSEQS